MPPERTGTEFTFEHRSGSAIDALELDAGKTHLKVMRNADGSFEKASISAVDNPGYNCQVNVKFAEGATLGATQAAIPGEELTLVIYRDRVGSATRRAAAW